MPYIDTYGSNQSIENTKNALEEILKISMTERHSSYFGTYYLFENEETEEEIKINANNDLIDNEPIESNFKDYSTIIYIEGINRPPEIHLRLSGIGLTLLKKYEYDEE